jgi:hypothetical protein
MIDMDTITFSTDPSFENYPAFPGEVGPPRRVQTFGMFTPAGTEAVAFLLLMALEGESIEELRSCFEYAKFLHSEITDTVVRDAMLESLPSGSEAQERMLATLRVTLICPCGTKTAEETSTHIINALTEANI